MSNTITASTQNDTPKKIKCRKKNDHFNAVNTSLVPKYQNCKKKSKKNQLFNRLLESNSGLIKELEKGFGEGNGFKDDFSSVAKIAFLDSLNNFDISKGNTFATFLTNNIKFALKKLNNRSMKVVSIPENKILEFRKLERNKDSAECNNEIHNLLGNGLMQQLPQDSDDSDVHFNVKSHSMDNSNISADVLLEEKDNSEAIRVALETLSPNEKIVIVESFGFNNCDKRNDTEIAIDLGKSVAGIGFIRKRALKKMRNNLTFTL